MSGDNEYEGATAGRVLNFNESEQIKFPNSFKHALGTDKGLMVMIYKDRLAKIFPLDTEEVSFLSLEIGKLTNDFLTKLSQIFKKAGLVDLLFSTGVCLRGSRCFYECYFSPSQLVIDMNELKNSLNDLSGVKNVVIEKVDI
jgi:hypothetical protein